MKYSIIIFFSIFILACTNTSNSEVAAETEGITTDTTDPIVNTTDTTDPIAKKDKRTDEEIIEDIKKKYEIVIEGKGTKKFKADLINYECADYQEEGELIYYTDERGVWLIEHSCSQGDHGGRTDQYFVWEKELFFLYSDESYWTFDAGNMDDGMQQNTVDYFTERRYYFNKGEVMKCLEKKYESRTSVKDNPKSENVHNVKIEPKDTKERLKRFNQLLSLVGEDDLEGNCIWE